MRNSTNELHLSTSLPVAVLLATLMVFSFALNFAVCAAIIRCAKLRIASSVFIFNLCLAGIFMTVFSMSLWLWFHIEGKHFAEQFRGFAKIYTLWNAVDIFSGTLSILSLAAISVDKFIAITRPLRYKADITKGTNSVAVIFIWIYSVSASSTYWARGDVSPKILGYLLLCICFILPLLVILVAYGKIYVIAKSHAHVLNMQAGRQKAKEIKAAKTIAIVIGTFCFCWIPFFLVVVLYSHGVKVQVEFGNAAKWLTYLNAFLNPAIYTFLDRRFRTVFFNKALPCFGQSHEVTGQGKDGSSDPMSSELRGSSLVGSRKRKESTRQSDVSQL